MTVIIDVCNKSHGFLPQLAPGFLRLANQLLSLVVQRSPGAVNEEPIPVRKLENPWSRLGVIPTYQPVAFRGSK
jgi:hypothetical protein